MQKELPTQAEVSRSFIAGLTSDTLTEKEAGLCWRFIRLRLKAAGFPNDLIPPLGSDASQAAQWYRTKHPELCVFNGSVPGDVLFYEIGHGPHGHVVGRIPKNLG